LIPDQQTTELTKYLMSPDEVAGVLGLGRTYTYQLLSTGTLPSVRIGILRKVRRTDVEQFIEDRLEPKSAGNDA
jgi:excisionase family DNA binding protein